MKKLLACAAAIAMAFGAASTANAATGSFNRDGAGNSYTYLQLDSGKNVNLYPVGKGISCGGEGAPYNTMGGIINSGYFNARVARNCGNLIRVCVSNQYGSACSTYARRPFQAPNVQSYDDGF